MLNISAIASVFPLNGKLVIGKKGEADLLWSDKEDLKFFKETTMYSIVIMGGNTLKSIGITLPNRYNMVISKRRSFDAYRKDGDDLDVFESLQSLMIMLLPLIYDSEASWTWNKDTWVIGGESIYKQMLPYISRITLTYIDHTKLLIPIEELEALQKEDKLAYFPDLPEDTWRYAETIPNVSFPQLDIKHYLRI